MKNFLLTLLFSGITGFCYNILPAQKVKDNNVQYVVNNEGDTLYGKFQKKLFDQSTFIIAGGEKIVLDPTEYTAYYTHHTLFRSIQLSENTSPKWMECLENGTICLYEYLMLQSLRPGQMPVNRVIWLAQKNGGQILNVTAMLSSENTARENVSALLADKPGLQNDFLSYNFSTKAVRYFIQQYNLQMKNNK